MGLKLILFLTVLTVLEPNIQGSNTEKLLNSQATITSIETNTSGRRTYDIAKIWFITTNGDTIATQVQLNGLPFIGSLKSAGDTVEITYQEDNPYLVKTVSESFLQKYAWYIIIGITLVFYGYRLVKRKKTAN